MKHSDGTKPRHLTSDSLREYLGKNVVARLPVEGCPPAYIDINAPGQSLTLRVCAPVLELSGLAQYRYLQVANLYDTGDHWVSISITAPESIYLVYTILCAIVDSVQVDGLALAEAIAVVLGRYKEILSGISRMSDDAEIGLFGELLVLDSLIQRLGATNAIRCWRGPSAEEHDFVLELQDVEVKTTTGEQRIHWISGLEQLQPTPDRRLWLVSLQLTGGGPSSPTLPGLIDRLRRGLSLIEDLHLFDAALQASNWSDDRASLFHRRFHLRTPPAIYAVGGDFPALTSTILHRGNIDTSLLRQVKYQLDLTHRETAAAIPDELQAIIPVVRSI